MDPVLLLHILYGKPFSPLQLFPLCTHLSLTHWFAFTVFLSLTGAVVPWHSRSCPISRPSSRSISMVPQARCVLRCSWGSQPTPRSGGCSKPPRDKAAGQPTLLGPGAAPVLCFWPVLACPRLGESRGCAPRIPSSSFCLCLL